MDPRSRLVADQAVVSMSGVMTPNGTSVNVTHPNDNHNITLNGAVAAGLLGTALIGTNNQSNSPNQSNHEMLPKGAGNHGNNNHHANNNQMNSPNGVNHGGPGGGGGGTGNAVNIADYFNQLVRDKKNLQYLPNYFLHCERLLDEEINKVKNLLCSATDRKPLDLPEPKGPTVTVTEKIFVPVDKYPNFNFVGRILGPQGTTAKDIEMFTGCKIMVRGEGSMRDKKKEEQLKGKPNFEHLNEKLHVLIQCEDTHNRSEIRMETVIKEIKKLLDPKPDGEDEIKRRQLMGLAVINGTYRETNNVKHHHHHHHANHNQQFNSNSQAAQQLAMYPELAGLLPTINHNAAALNAATSGLNPALDQAAILAQLNQASLASLIGSPLRAVPPTVSSANGMGRFGVSSLLNGTGTAGLPVTASGQNAFLHSPTADASLFYAAAGYDPTMLQLGLLTASSPAASQSDIGSGVAGNSESSFGAQKTRKLTTGIRTASPYTRHSGGPSTHSSFY